LPPLLKRFSRHFNRVPHSAFTSKGDNARPNRHGRTAYADDEEKAKQLADQRHGVHRTVDQLRQDQVPVGVRIPLIVITSSEPS